MVEEKAITEHKSTEKLEMKMYESVETKILGRKFYRVPTSVLRNPSYSTDL